MGREWFLQGFAKRMSMRKRWVRSSVGFFLILGFFFLYTKAIATEPYVIQTKKDCTECHTDRYYPGKDFFQSETKMKWRYHWWAFSLSLLIFLGGIFGRIYLWSIGHGKVLLPQRKVERGKILNLLFFEALLQKSLLKLSRLRWFIFFSESFGFMALFVVFLIFVFTRFVFKIDFFIKGPGGLLLDFLMDLLGLLIFIGAIVSLMRRWKKSPDRITEREDILAVLFLFFIVLTGFFLEAFRLAVLPVSWEAYFSFVGFGLALFLRKIPLSWTDIHFYTWLVHATLVFMFLAYIPFSKLIHFIGCPLTILGVSSDSQG